jgi:hypothetical protein
VVYTSYFGTIGTQIGSGARWIVSQLLHSAGKQGLEIHRCSWTEDDDDEGEERHILTFWAGGTEHWEPFDTRDLEDAPKSPSVRRHIEQQLSHLLGRLKSGAGVRQARVIG